MVISGGEAMDILKQLNDAVAYIVENICTDKIVRIALCSYDKFSRYINECYKYRLLSYISSIFFYSALT